MRERKFYYHYDRHGEKNMIVHYKGRNRRVSNISCSVPCKTKWRKSQPKLVMEGFCKRVDIVKLHDDEKIAIIR